MRPKRVKLASELEAPITAEKNTGGETRPKGRGRQNRHFINSFINF